jgi:hypothetical protein
MVLVVPVLVVTVLVVTVLTVMEVDARTGRLGLLSAARYSGAAAAAGQRGQFLGVVAQRFAQLLVQRRVVVVEVAEEVSDAGSRHSAIVGPTPRRRPSSPAGKWRQAGGAVPGVPRREADIQVIRWETEKLLLLDDASRRYLLW